MHVGRPPTLARSPSYPACLGFTPFSAFAHPIIGAYPLGQGLFRPGQPPPGPQRKYTKIAPRELGGAVDLRAPPVEGSDRGVRVAAETNSSVEPASNRAGEQGDVACSAGAGGLGVAKGEESSETQVAPRKVDDYASGAPELPPLLASSVDDVLPGEPASSRSSTEATAMEPAAESAAESAPVLKPEAS